jgi:hypothetical protein
VFDSQPAYPSGVLSSPGSERNDNWQACAEMRLPNMRPRLKCYERNIFLVSKYRVMKSYEGNGLKLRACFIYALDRDECLAYGPIRFVPEKKLLVPIRQETLSAKSPAYL